MGEHVMSARATDRSHQNVSPQPTEERRPWSPPKLTVRAIEDVTHGTRASVNTDATQRNDNS